jgi:hypothetical protein
MEMKLSPGKKPFMKRIDLDGWGKWEFARNKEGDAAYLKRVQEKRLQEDIQKARSLNFWGAR